ncbi:hypothetical protein [Niallia oryzisoli]|uniref:hypothetical protein n=1 Tax=Niallia oryzisoli TaxID=1737571 RepID=UPI003735AA52
MKKTKQHESLNLKKRLYNKQEDFDNDPVGEEEHELVPHQSGIRRSIWIMSLVLIGISILGGFFTTSFTDEGTAEEVVANRISSATAAGEELFSVESNANIESRNFEVTDAGRDGGEARMLLWDFNAIDFDEVAVFVDGAPIKEKLILSDNAISISIPVPSLVTISGVKDNGGGISYAVKFPNNHNTYFNVVTVGGSNTYTVLPKP